MVLNGIAGYAQDTLQVQRVIDYMTVHKLNCWRMGFSPTYIYSNPNSPYDPALIQYFLDNSPYTIIININNYSPSEAYDNLLKVNMSQVKQYLIDVGLQWNGNPRVMIETINEYTSSDDKVVNQELITAVRNAGVTNTIVINWHGYNYFRSYSDPLNDIIQGVHIYFKDPVAKWNQAIAIMEDAINQGLRIINTEIGANEASHLTYTVEQVTKMNEFMAWCTERGIGNTVWMFRNLVYEDVYNSLGIKYPTEMIVGVSGRPSTWGSDTNYQTSIVQEVIDFMDNKKLNTYRMCFFIGTPESTIRNCVQYYLDNCDHTLILNYYHNAGPSVNWDDSTNLALSLMSTFSSYQDRIILEPYNQFAQSFTKIQDFVDVIRNAGYTTKIYCSRWYTQDAQDFVNINDSLYEHIICGQQQYMDVIGLAGAISRTQTFLDAGVEIIDGEVGAHIKEYPEFTQSLVNAVNTYLEWAKDNGVGACVWMLQGIRNWGVNSQTSYKNLGLNYPNGGEIMANVVFNGTVKDKVSSNGINGANGVIVITSPTGTIETLNISSDANGNFTTNNSFSLVGGYEVDISLSVDGYNDGTLHDTFNIEAVLKDMVITLNVTVE